MPGLTDSDGNYVFENIRNGTYTLTPAKTSFIFNPDIREITVNGADAVVEIFTGSIVESIKNIAGKVVDWNKKPLPDIRMSLNPVDRDDLYETHEITDEDGNYSFNDIPEGTYRLIAGHHPSYPSYDCGYVFHPEYIDITIDDSNVHEEDFVGWHLISGRITECPEEGQDSSQAKGIPFVEVKYKEFGISWEGATLSMGATTTDNDGYYEFNRIWDGNFKITPKKSGYEFEPEFKIVVVENVNVKNVDFEPKDCSDGGGGENDGGGGDDAGQSRTFTLDILQRLEKTSEITHLDETLMWTGSVVFSVPINDDGEWGSAVGDGELSITGSGSFQDDDAYCEWTTTGNIQATVTGSSAIIPYGSSQAQTHVFNLSLGFATEGQKNCTLRDSQGTHVYTDPITEVPVNTPLVIPVEDGYTIEQDINQSADVKVHIKYVLHFGE